MDFWATNTAEVITMKHAQRCWIGFDLGGTKMLAVVFDERFRVLGTRRRKSKGQAGAKVGIARIAETIDEALAEAKIPLSALAGIGLAF
jgi:glucokinase